MKTKYSEFLLSEDARILQMLNCFGDEVSNAVCVVLVVFGDANVSLLNDHTMPKIMSVDIVLHTIKVLDSVHRESLRGHLTTFAQNDFSLTSAPLISP